MMDYRANRETLKAALRAHGKQFDMSVELTWKGERPKTPTLGDFEKCGSACCVEGMARLLWPRLVRGFYVAMEACGFENADFYILASWPYDLRDKYRDARGRDDHAAMAEAACEMIDSQPYPQEALM